jgi:hypothetical protein
MHNFFFVSCARWTLALRGLVEPRINSFSLRTALPSAHWYGDWACYFFHRVTAALLNDK